MLCRRVFSPDVDAAALLHSCLHSCPLVPKVMSMNKHLSLKQSEMPRMELLLEESGWKTEGGH